MRKAKKDTTKFGDQAQKGKKKIKPLAFYQYKFNFSLFNCLTTFFFLLITR